MRALMLVPIALSLTAQSAEEFTTSLKDQKSLAVTIYNENLALVKDQREVRLPKGTPAWPSRRSRPRSGPRPPC